MRRLYRKIYLTIIASLILVVAVAGLFWRSAPDASPAAQAFEMVGELVAAALPPAEAPPAEQRNALERLRQRFHTDLTLFDAGLGPVATAGRPLPAPRRSFAGWSRDRTGPLWNFELPDGRWLVVRPPPRHRPSPLRFVAFLGAIALAAALCAYPVVRGLTRRLERLQESVETLGAGNLSARVKVEGRDEVARLAEAFNRAAARIEELVAAHRLMLAHASHELRTPLSRIRLGIELIAERPDRTRKAALERDIAELDGLIDEILLASRLDVTPAPQVTEEIDLLALAAEECARYDACSLDGQSVLVRGDPRLLRRLVRNLLDNAARHGRPPIRVEVRHEGGQALLEVIDAGEGVPEAERERVFMPFRQLRPESGGAGLGLSLVRRIARLHGGEAELAPRPGEPSRFRVSLPAAPVTPGADAGDSSAGRFRATTPH
jgi:signal transduction histidine kinase